MLNKFALALAAVIAGYLGFPEVSLALGFMLSTTLTTAAVSSFDAMVKHDYQAQGVLRKHVRVKSGVVGSTHRFTTYSKGTATPRIPQTDVVPMNTGPSVVTATIADWNAPQYTDIFNQQKVNFQEQSLLSYTIAGAIGRREDQLIIDALEAAATSLTITNDIGGTDTNLNTAKMRQAKKLLDAKNVPQSDRKVLIHSNNLYGLLGDSDATTFDKNVVKALVDGEIKRWLGFDFIVLGDYDEGGLTLATSDRTIFFFHGGPMGSVGHAVGMDFRTEVNYIAEKTSWLANGLFAAGSTYIDANGIVECVCRE